MKRQIHPDVMRAGIDGKFSIPISISEKEHLQKQLQDKKKKREDYKQRTSKIRNIDETLSNDAVKEYNKEIIQLQERINKLPKQSKSIKTIHTTRPINFDKLNEDFELIYSRELKYFFYTSKGHNKNPKRFIENEVQWTKECLGYFRPGETYFNLLQSYNDFLSNKINPYANPGKILSLKSNLSKEQIEKLFELLCPKYLQTDLNIFKSIFADKIIPLKKPIQWNKSNRLLAYFFNSKIINSTEWQSVIEKGNLFLNKKGKEITASDLATALNYIKTVELPKEHKEIDAIISELKKTLRV